MSFAIALAVAVLPTPDPNPVPAGFLARLGDSRFRHGSDIQDGTFSPDRTLFATAGSERMLRLWDTRTGRLLLDVGRPDSLPDAVAKVRFSPDGKWVGVSMYPWYTQVWNAHTKKPIVDSEAILSDPESVWKGHDFFFSPDSRAIAIAHGSEFWFLSLPGGVLVHKVEVVGLSWGETALSPDGKRLFNSSSEGAAIWDLETERLPRPLNTGGKWISRAAFSEDGQRILGLCDGAVRSWDVATGQVKVIVKEREAVEFDFAPKARRFAVSDSTGAVRLYHSDTGKQLRAFNLGMGTAWREIRLSADGTRLALVDEHVRIWDLQTGREQTWNVGHADRITCVRFHEDDRSLITIDESGRVIRWNRLTGRGRILTDLHQSGIAARISSDGLRVMLTERGIALDKPRLWSTATGTEQPLENAPRGTIYGTAFCDGDRKLMCILNGALHVWDSRTGKALKSGIPFRGGFDNFGVRFSPDGRMVADAGGFDDGISIRRLPDLKRLHELKRGDYQPDLAFSPDGRTIAWVDQFPGESTIQLVIAEPATKFRHSFEFEHSLDHLTFSSDGTMLAATVQDPTGNRILLWELATLRLIRRSQPTGAACSSLSFSHDGRTVAAGLADGTILLWDVVGHNDRK